MKPINSPSHAAKLGRLMRAPKQLTSSQRKAKARTQRATEAPPPGPRRGTPEHSKARNARRNARRRAGLRLALLGQEQAKAQRQGGAKL